MIAALQTVAAAAVAQQAVQGSYRHQELSVGLYVPPLQLLSAHASQVVFATFAV